MNTLWDFWVAEMSALSKRLIHIREQNGGTSTGVITRELDDRYWVDYRGLLWLTPLPLGWSGSSHEIMKNDPRIIDVDEPRAGRKPVDA